ncbi:hypothetical protein TNCV_4130331 [Trichonephila clavipes]|nr:hypothetical protein TNCV_4130331 [Trichonephila clavipes]
MAVVFMKTLQKKLVLMGYGSRSSIRVPLPTARHGIQRLNYSLKTSLRYNTNNPPEKDEILSESFCECTSPDCDKGKITVDVRSVALDGINGNPLAQCRACMRWKTPGLCLVERNFVEFKFSVWDDKGCILSANLRQHRREETIA